MPLDPIEPPIVRRVHRMLKQGRGRRIGPNLVVAVSGGGDSVALLRAVVEAAPTLGLRLSVAHLDHGTRGDASRADARFVADLAEALGLPLDLGQWTPDRPAHFEADARRARYAWLLEVARSRGASAVLVGHTRDDQAETVLHRIVRGTGPRGLAGIPRCRSLADGVELLRPLLTTSRGEARAYLNALGQTWREDLTNADTGRTRPLIRHEILPSLAALNPRVIEALARLADLSRSTVLFNDARLGALADRSIVESESTGLVLRRDLLGRRSRAVRVAILRIAWRRLGWPEGTMSAARWNRLATLIRSGQGRHSIGVGVELLLTDDRARLVPSSVPIETPPSPVPLPVPGVADWDGRRLTVAPSAPDSPALERIDRDTLSLFDGPIPHLTIGPPRPGDRFEPLGMDGRSMPLADFLRGRRVPKPERAHIPILRDRHGILWVAGHRIAHRVRLTSATRHVLALGLG